MRKKRENRRKKCREEEEKKKVGERKQKIVTDVEKRGRVKEGDKSKDIINYVSRDYKYIFL